MRRILRLAAARSPEEMQNHIELVYFKLEASQHSGNGPGVSP